MQVGAKAALLQVGLGGLEPAGVGQVIEPDTRRRKGLHPPTQTRLGLLQKGCPREADALDQPFVADGLSVEPDGDQLGVGREIGAKGLELDAGRQAMAVAEVKGARIEFVKPGGVGAMGLETIGEGERVGAVGAKQRRASGCGSQGRLPSEMCVVWGSCQRVDSLLIAAASASSSPTLPGKTT